jgi:hypothetical protein
MTTPPTISTDPILIGLVGPSGSGKSTAAQYLEVVHGFAPCAFADTLKDMLDALFVECGVDYAHLHEPELKNVPLPRLHGLSARQLMTSLGDWGRSVAPDFWIERLAQRMGLYASSSAPVHDRIVVSDVRYQNEAAWITRAGGRLVRLERADVDDVDPAIAAAGSGPAHSSEREHTGIAAWWRIANHSGLSHLHNQLDGMLDAGWPGAFGGPLRHALDDHDSDA